jgi:SAM-dependent methyltransferase
MIVLRKAYDHVRNIPHAAKRTAEFYRAKQTLLGSKELSDVEKQLLARISVAVHREDSMHVPGYARDYLSAGLSATRCIRAALQSIGKERAVGAILDFPCGYGRVLRFLRAMFRESDITGSEIQNAALDFCQRTFGVVPLLSSIDLKSLSLPRKFDLIWCGSLITHIDENATADLLRLFSRHLCDDGICIFTTHGQVVVKGIKDKTQTFGLSEKNQQKLLRDFQEEGYGYADYSHRTGYGISVVSHSRMVELASGVGTWEEAFYLDHGWDGLQDVFGFVMRAPEKEFPGAGNPRA